MTEVPDYLLERSRQRRAALGLPGGGAPAGSPAAPSSAPSGAGPAPTPAVAASVPAADLPAAVAVAAEPDILPVAHASGPRSGIPIWMMPVLLILPFWGVIYMGAFAKPKAAAGPLTGAQIFVKAGCSGCHGATGGGGVGPKLAGGEAKLTFPNEADQIAWVENGSGPAKGMLYGDPNRPGGQHGPAQGGMPAFKGQLTPDEIQAVVTYEREKL